MWRIHFHFCWFLNLHALYLENVSRHSYRDMSVTYCTRIWICLWHTVQVYGFSPERVFCWSLNLHALENVSRHSLQGYVCTSIWLLSWMSLLLILKPTCFRKCLMTYFTGICLWYTVQGYGFSPERVFCWSLNLHALKNVSRHSLQGYVSRKWLLPKKGFSPKKTSPLKMVSPQSMAFSRNNLVG